jgi:hypothetical protein
VAKQQSFADKSKGKTKSDTSFVKCIVSMPDERKGTWKFREKMVKVKDPKDIQNMQF